MLITAPEVKSLNANNIFLAGGITNCWNWQEYVIGKLHDLDIDIINPRRTNFDLSDTKNTEIQILWEYNYLNLCNSCMFWFSHETMCPITLYELGKMHMSNKPLFIGVDPRYQRLEDVVFQTKLIRPELNVYQDLDMLVDNIKTHFGQ